MGGEPQLAPPIPQGYAQTEDLEAGRARATMHKDRMDIPQREEPTLRAALWTTSKTRF
jgi:hypothetical protein